MVNARRVKIRHPTIAGAFARIFLPIPRIAERAPMNVPPVHLASMGSAIVPWAPYRVMRKVFARIYRATPIIAECAEPLVPSAGNAYLARVFVPKEPRYAAMLVSRFLPTTTTAAVAAMIVSLARRVSVALAPATQVSSRVLVVASIYPKT